MAENFSGRDVALDIVVGTQAGVLSTPLGIAQAEIIAAFQAAGSDAAALSSRLGVSIAFLSVTATKIVTQKRKMYRESFLTAERDRPHPCA